MRLALVEIQRRGVENAKQAGAVMDGAEWEQGFVDHHCPDALRILDFPHAGEHISPIGEFLMGEGTAETKQWVGERLHQLKHEGPAGLLAEFRDLQKQHPDEKAITGNLAYLEKREAQMQYPQFQAQGWPIGSGIVESGNKLVVEARLKGSGMHWAGEHVNPMLAMRNILCSDRWKEDWPKVATRLRQQNARKRQVLHQARASAESALTQQLLLQSSTVSENAQAQIATEPIPPALPDQPKPNPWGKFKYGKAFYQRSVPSKK